uniref:Uncharacterized protein n=1 Tax=Anguilla anguilla TaxID=7936 RepID=A0A0E9TH03_ANGAN
MCVSLGEGFRHWLRSPSEKQH